MMVTPNGSVVVLEENAAKVILTNPVKCGCGVMCYFVVNRDGKTRCVACDAEYFPVR